MKDRLEALEKEAAALRKTNRVLMDRIEGIVDSAGNDYAILERNILLHQRVKERTAALEESNRQLARHLEEQTRIGEDLRRGEWRAIQQRTALAVLLVDPILGKGELDAALGRIVQVLADTLEVARASIWLFAEDRARLVCRALYDARTRTHADGAVLTEEAVPVYFQSILKESRVVAEDAQNDPRTKELSERLLKPLGVASTMDAGVMVDGQLAGGVHLSHIGPRRKWHADEESFVAAISALVAQLLVEAERRRAEAALRESEARFKALHDASFGGIEIHDQGRILDCNQGLSDLTGYPRAELIGMDGLRLISAKSREMVKGMILARYEKPYEAVGVRRNGEEFPLRISAREIPYRGKPVRAVEFRDITEQKRAEAALRESEEKLRALFSSMTETVAMHEVVTDRMGQAVDYRFTDCNPAYCEAAGVAREAIAGRLATEVYGTPVAPYLEEFCRVGLTGEPHTFETYFPIFGKYYSISVVSPGKNRFATIGTDITGVKRSQHVIAAKNRELEQLVYVASHDLRSPLVNVDGYGRELEYAVGDLIQAFECEEKPAEKLEALLRAHLPEMTGALRHIRASTRQMDTLLKGLLKLSRTGRMALTIGPVDMDRLVARVVSTLQYQIRELGAEVRVGGLPPCRGDETQIVQVFTNLIGNALKYRDPGRAPVIAVGGDVEHGRCVYRVEDNGIGIPPGQREKVFELFHRVDPAKAEGEGLGLTIVRQILGRLEGEIWVESTPGVGSCFYVALPVDPTMPMKRTEEK